MSCGSAPSCDPGLPDNALFHRPGDEPAIAAHSDGASDSFDDEFEPSEWDEDNLSDTTSINSSIYAHTYEHGRRFHKYRHGRYPIPNDDQEQSREDMKHAMYMELTNGELFYSPIGDNPQKILDIGTGTGLWAIEVGDKFPSAIVTGLDLSPIQPVWIPPNVNFIIDDAEDEWMNGSAWDLVHCRGMSTTIKDPHKLCQQTFDNLKPGGWMEWQEQHANFLCDDGTMNPDDDLIKLYRLATQAFERIGYDVHLASKLREPLEKAGFVNVRCVVKKIPIGTWPADKTLRLVGMYMKTAIQSFLPVIIAKPLALLGIPEDEREVWRALALRSLSKSDQHRY
ncbi:S-adenosyl-L-methionine-dependent methyltransferase [Microdochium trichocladiopsis]|uniref:S-adenosyl-L-methionine-dependent methyltransferase n=1 Tax=Microdochium trichocladiopsis TaxID=1682393 RepID=A0A9P9BKI5_9PEZI|nr:S-adenosyl-L-methionine-dependent methyltransferase [Microdochium trichocladiopsis]KAH7018556.1 S-adenosyl-L-methionine-dependent methyltransferase [Microdochium trichocladiopsis]